MRPSNVLCIAPRGFTGGYNYRLDGGYQARFHIRRGVKRLLRFRKPREDDERPRNKAERSSEQTDPPRSHGLNEYHASGSARLKFTSIVVYVSLYPLQPSPSVLVSPLNMTI